MSDPHGSERSDYAEPGAANQRWKCPAWVRGGDKYEDACASYSLQSEEEDEDLLDAVILHEVAGKKASWYVTARQNHHIRREISWEVLDL